MYFEIMTVYIGIYSSDLEWKKRFSCDFDYYICGKLNSKTKIKNEVKKTLAKKRKIKPKEKKKNK